MGCTPKARLTTRRWRPHQMPTGRRRRQAGCCLRTRSWPHPSLGPEGLQSRGRFPGAQSWQTLPGALQGWGGSACKRQSRGNSGLQPTWLCQTGDASTARRVHKHRRLVAAGSPWVPTCRRAYVGAMQPRWPHRVVAAQQLALLEAQPGAAISATVLQGQGQECKTSQRRSSCARAARGAAAKATLGGQGKGQDRVCTAPPGASTHPCWAERRPLAARARCAGGCAVTWAARGCHASQGALQRPARGRNNGLAVYRRQERVRKRKRGGRRSSHRGAQTREH